MSKVNVCTDVFLVPKCIVFYCRWICASCRGLWVQYCPGCIFHVFTVTGVLIFRDAIFLVLYVYTNSRDCKIIQGTQVFFRDATTFYSDCPRWTIFCCLISVSHSPGSDHSFHVILHEVRLSHRPRGIPTPRYLLLSTYRERQNTSFYSSYSTGKELIYTTPKLFRICVAPTTLGFYCIHMMLCWVVDTWMYMKIDLIHKFLNCPILRGTCR